jgi:hypothetical protein
MSLPTSDSATVTVLLRDWTHIEREFELLRKQLKQATANTTAVVPIEAQAVLAALESALPIVQFAVGNIPPESVRGWPVASLTTLADQLKALFPDDADRQSMVIAFREVAADAVDIDKFRARRTEAAARVSEMTTPVENA